MASRSMFPANLKIIRLKISEYTHARAFSTHTHMRALQALKKAHNTCHDPYNVPSKFGEDPLRNVETYSRTDRHPHTDTHTYRQTDRHTHTNSPMYSKIRLRVTFVGAEATLLEAQPKLQMKKVNT
jgi:hypothetical protein